MSEEQKTVWVVGEVFGDRSDWELQGIFSTKDAALAICGPNARVAPMLLDVDYTAAGPQDFEIFLPDGTTAK